TIAILLPALIGFQNNYKTVGLTISLGALCVSLTDAPGPGMHKRNGMLFCSLFIFLIAAITAHAKANVLLMGLEIAVVCFVFSMFSVYGDRAGSVGNAAILVMILTMDDPTIAGNIGFHSSLIMMGGLWYMSISLLVTIFRPYRLAQRVLGDCIREIAQYLQTKGAFYQPATDLQQNYTKLIGQQIMVHEKQDAVREVLFKTRVTVKESTPMGRKLVMTFVEAVDFFEDTTTAYYDYSELRKQFSDQGILEKIGNYIQLLSSEVEHIASAIQMNTKYRPLYDLDAAIALLKHDIDETGHGTQSNFVLKKILVNLRSLTLRVNNLKLYFSADFSKEKKSMDHSHFVSHQPMGADALLNNLSLQSSAFRHAIRVSVACLIGFLIVRFIDYGQHSYWILLTIAFILKPAFSLTKERNKQRLTGTLIGGAAGILILMLITNATTLFIIMVVFMLGTYSFLRTNYLAMVLCVTPFVLILFNFLGMGFIEVAKERVFDTLIGCAIAFPVSYFLLPNWESEQLVNHIRQVLKANAAYLEKILQALRGNKINMLEYKLARKEVYVQTANLSALFHRMLSEPKSKQKSSEKVHEFVVMNNIFFSNIATISTSLLTKESREYYKPLVISGQRALVKLNQNLANIDPSYSIKDEMPGKKEWSDENPSADDLFLKQQLDYLCKLADDMKKTTKIIGA
ncbi:MAG: FUSC family protein, partial [Flavisolibacter sp.]|nr:FUSC family protein [Flavisolibacter sp.]